MKTMRMMKLIFNTIKARNLEISFYYFMIFLSVVFIAGDIISQLNFGILLVINAILILIFSIHRIIEVYK